MLAIPPLLKVDAGEFFRLPIEVLTFNAHLQLHFTRHLDTPEGAVVESLILRAGRDAGIHRKRAERPIAVIQRLFCARCGRTLANLRIERRGLRSKYEDKYEDKEESEI